MTSKTIKYPYEPPLRSSSSSNTIVVPPCRIRRSKVPVWTMGEIPVRPRVSFLTPRNPTAAEYYYDEQFLIRILLLLLRTILPETHIRARIRMEIKLPPNRWITNLMMTTKGNRYVRPAGGVRVRLLYVPTREIRVPSLRHGIPGRHRQAAQVAPIQLLILIL